MVWSTVSVRALADRLPAFRPKGEGRCLGDCAIFPAEAYRGRNGVERCFSRLKRFRAVATRFGKLAAHYRAGVVIASRWSRGCETQRADLAVAERVAAAI